jgi:hypothetical protein
MLNNQKWEYASVEWLWQAGSIRCNMPSGEESKDTGSYTEVVQTLSRLGQEGWEVATCVAGGDWIYWTLKKSI